MCFSSKYVDGLDCHLRAEGSRLEAACCSDHVRCASKTGHQHTIPARPGKSASDVNRLVNLPASFQFLSISLLEERPAIL